MKGVIMKGYRDFVMKGFYRGLSEIVKHRTGHRMSCTTLGHWIVNGSQDRPIQMGPVVVARVKQDIVIYSWRHTIGVPIPPIVWTCWPRNMMGIRF